MVTTHQNPQTETHNFKKEETEGKSMECHQTKTRQKHKGKEPIEGRH